MVTRMLPLLLGVCIFQQQYHTGSAHFYEPYQTQHSFGQVASSPLTSVNPYPVQYRISDLGEQRSIPTVEQTQFFGYNSGSPVTYRIGESRIPQPQPQPQPSPPQQQQLQPQQYFGGLQSIGTRQQPSPQARYFPMQQESRSVPGPQSFPNFVYTRDQSQGQLSRTISPQMSSQNEVIFPLGQPAQTVRRVPIGPPAQGPPSFIPLTPQPAPQPQSPPSPQGSVEEIIPLQNLLGSKPDSTKVFTIKNNPFVISTFKPKQPSVTVVPNSGNPLETLTNENIFDVVLNKDRSSGSHTSQVIFNTNTETFPTEETVISTTHSPTTQQPSHVTEVPHITYQEKANSPTTPMTLVTLSTTTTTTEAPLPETHRETTVTEKHFYVNKKKKITVIIKVEDAEHDAAESDVLVTRPYNHNFEWTKTVLESTNIFEEKDVKHSEESREIEGYGKDTTKFICQNYIDGVLIPTGLQNEGQTCRGPISSDDPWNIAYSRIQTEVMGLRDRLRQEESKASNRQSASANFGPSSNDAPVSAPKLTSLLHEKAEPLNLSEGWKAFNTLAGEYRPATVFTSKREADKTLHLIENPDLSPTDEDKSSTDAALSEDSVIKVAHNQTSKRETKPEAIAEIKAEEEVPVISSTEEHTTESHIMIITKTPATRTPSPYNHLTKDSLPVTSSSYETVSLPEPQALQSSTKTENAAPSLTQQENKVKTFFRRST